MCKGDFCDSRMEFLSAIVSLSSRARAVGIGLQASVYSTDISVAGLKAGRPSGFEALLVSRGPACRVRPIMACWHRGASWLYLHKAALESSCFPRGNSQWDSNAGI